MQYVLAVLVAGTLWYLLFKRQFDFVIRLSDGEVTFRGDVPRSRRRRIAEFLQREFSGYQRLSVSGKRTPSGRLVLRIRPKLTPGEEQQIRNFLLNIK